MNVIFLFVQPSPLQVTILLIILCAIINIYNLLQDECERPSDTINYD